MSRFLSTNNFLKADLSNLPPQSVSIIENVGFDALLNENGKIKSEYIPDIAITNVFVVSDLVARDNLIVQTGDVCKILSSGLWYIYDGTQWIALTTPGGSTSLVLLTDTLISSPENFQVLTYNNNFWRNEFMTMSKLNDVDTTILNDNDILQFKTGTSKWEPGELNLNKNTDVNYNSITNNQVLAWNNTQFENKTLQLNDLSDVDVSVPPGLNHVLAFDSFNFRDVRIQDLLPLNTQGDIMYLNSGTLAKVGVGSENQLLSVNASAQPEYKDIENVLPQTTEGDMMYLDNTLKLEKIGIGADKSFLRSNGTIPIYETETEVLKMDTIGDMIYHDNGINKLSVGANNTILKSNGNVPVYDNIVNVLGLTTNYDMLYRDGTGNANRIPIGTPGSFLKSVDSNTIGFNFIDFTDLTSYIDNAETGGQFMMINDASIGPQYQKKSIQKPLINVLNSISLNTTYRGSYMLCGGTLASDITITINLLHTFYVGDECDIVNYDTTYKVTFIADTGITLESKDGNLVLANKFDACSLKYLGLNKFILIGNLSA
jgi:hypothetical protein